MLFFDGGIALVFNTLFVIAFCKRGLKQLFTATFWTLLLTSVFVVLCSKLGILEDRVNIRVLGTQTGAFFSGVYRRHTFGFLVQNQLPNTFLVIYLLSVIIYKEKYSIIFDFLLLPIDYILLLIFGARTSFALVAATIISHIITLFMEKKKIFFDCSKSSRIPFIFLLCSVLSLGLCLLYSNESNAIKKLDLIFNNRLRLGNNALSYYGIKLFGSGKTSGTYSGALMNNTVDNGYVILFIQYGLFIGIFVLLLWTWVAIIVKRDAYWKLAIIAFSLLNIIDSYLTSYLAIPFICVLLNKDDLIIIRTHLRAQMYLFVNVKEEDRTTSEVVIN